MTTPTTAPKSRAPLKWAGVGVGVGAGVAGLAYIGINNPTGSSGFIPCPFKAITGLDCPFCGTTRALHDLLNGDIVSALSHNLVTISLLFIIGLTFLISRLRKRPAPRLSNATWIAIGVFLLAFTVARNLPISPFEWLDAKA